MTELTTTLRDIQHGLRPIRHNADGSLNAVASAAIKKLTIAIAVAEEIEEGIANGDPSADTFSASDRIDLLIRRFRDFEHCGLTMSSEDITALINGLTEARARARALQSELSKWRWNDLRDDRDHVHAPLQAVSQQGNVVQLGPKRRPTANRHGMPPEGGAA